MVAGLFEHRNDFDLSVIEENRISGETAALLMKAYKDLMAIYNSYPSLQEISDCYCAMIDSKIIALQAEIYPDDFFQEEHVGERVLPDMIRHNIENYLNAEQFLMDSEIISFLNARNLVYVNNRILSNTPFEAVW